MMKDMKIKSFLPSLFQLLHSCFVVLLQIKVLRAPKSEHALPPPLPLYLLMVQSAFPSLWKIASIMHCLRKEMRWLWKQQFSNSSVFELGSLVF